MMTQTIPRETPGFHPVPGWTEANPAREPAPARPPALEVFRPPLAFPGRKQAEAREPARSWRRSLLAAAFVACVVCACCVISLFRMG